MRDLLSWNLPLGRWAGVNVRLHVFFLILGLVFWQAAIVSDDPSLRWNYALMLGVLLISVLVHETAHVATSARLGYIPEQVVLWPLGGLAHVGLPHQPLAELITALAGPLANLTIAAVCMLALLLTRPDLLSFNPLAPPYSDTIHGPLVLAIAFWVNWVLVLVNLLPAAPLDAGRAVRALLWIRVGARSAAVHSAALSRLTGVLLLILGLIAQSKYPFAVLPMGLLGCVLFFAPRSESERLAEIDGDETPLGYDFSQGYTSLERHSEPATSARRRASLFRRWLERRRQLRLRKQQQREEEEDRKADDILARLHTYGVDGLSSEDRAILNRVSARLRNKERQ